MGAGIITASGISGSLDAKNIAMAVLKKQIEVSNLREICSQVDVPELVDTIPVQSIPEGAEDLGDLMAKVVVPALGSVLLGVLTALAERLRRKTGIEIERRVLEEAVHYAEAAGNAYLLDNGHKLPGDISQQLALEYASERTGRRLGPEDSERLRHSIDATVQRVFNQDRDYSLDLERRHDAASKLKDAARLLRGAMNGRPEPEHIDDTLQQAAIYTTDQALTPGVNCVAVPPAPCEKSEA